MSQTYEDRPTLERWNKLVATVGSMPKVASGTYTGNGETRSQVYCTQTITLGFRPKAVLIVGNEGMGFGDSSSYIFAYLMVDGVIKTVTNSGDNRPLAQVTNTGFLVGSYYTSWWYTPMINVGSKVYHYVAIG